MSMSSAGRAAAPSCRLDGMSMSAAQPRPVRDDLPVLCELVPPAGRDVLDVGCGQGELTRALAAEGARAVGMEISEERRDAARARDPGGAARYVAGRAEALPLDASSMDVVVFMRSLHHVPAELMGAALAEARRVLRPGGFVYVAEPLTDGPMFALVRRVDDETEVRAQAQAALERAPEVGLERVRTVEYEVSRSFPDLAALRRVIVGADPGRADAFDAAAEDLARDFAALGEPDGAGGRRLSQPMRVDLLTVR
jgi:ubiquinone/menaquinone biosynthesis C-methylase UbiE